jgi:predicted RNA binding protein YcfA (HicA-like mRNA interferase family)
MRRWANNAATKAHRAHGVEGPSTKIAEVIRLIEQDGRHQIAQRGSHRQFKHPDRPGRVTVAGKPSDDVAPGTLNSILKQAGLKGSV